MTDNARKSLSLRAPLPVRLLREAARRAEKWPLAGDALRRVRTTQDWALVELKQRLDDLNEAGFPRRTPPVAGQGCRQTLAKLLVEADRLTLEQASQQQYAAVLAQLCPDQAKMLAVLADGRRLPLMHVAAGPPVGPIHLLVLENVTSLGREAGVTLREQVPRLVGHMRALGLLDVGPKAGDLKTAYDLLAADTAVRTASAYIKETLGQWPRLQRFSVRLSAFGQDLWRAAGPGT